MTAVLIYKESTTVSSETLKTVWVVVKLPSHSLLQLNKTEKSLLRRK